MYNTQYRPLVGRTLGSRTSQVILEWVVRPTRGRDFCSALFTPIHRLYEPRMGATTNRTSKEVLLKSDCWWLLVEGGGSFVFVRDDELVEREVLLELRDELWVLVVECPLVARGVGGINLVKYSAIIL